MQTQHTTFPSAAVMNRIPPITEIVKRDEIAEERALVAQVADAYARQDVFDDYHKRKAENTLRAQLVDLDHFSAYLVKAKWPNPPSGEELQTDATAWQGITQGNVTGFRNWQLKQGYATATVNRRLSTVRKYCKLAFAAGVIDEEKHASIAIVQGYCGKDAKRIDERREDAGVAVRVGHKKAEHVSLTDDQAAALKTQPDTPQGRRDALMMCLLLDHGLRVGEVARVRVADVDLKAGELVFYRPKVDKTQRHKLTADTLRAAHAWVDSGDCPKRVGDLGVAVGHYRDELHVTKGGTKKYRKRDTLSAHDCRHYWATHWAGKVDVFRLQEAGAGRRLLCLADTRNGPQLPTKAWRRS